jgi:hypothetical protein
MAANAIHSDHMSIGIVVELIAISSDCASKDVDGGFDSGFNIGFGGRFDGGFDGWLHLDCAGLSTSAKRSTAQTRGFHSYQPRGLNGLVIKQTRHFIRGLGREEASPTHSEHFCAMKKFY